MLESIDFTGFLKTQISPFFANPRPRDTPLNYLKIIYEANKSRKADNACFSGFVGLSQKFSKAEIYKKTV